jgi:hypothetical protein
VLGLLHDDAEEAGDILDVTFEARGLYIERDECGL